MCDMDLFINIVCEFVRSWQLRNTLLHVGNFEQRISPALQEAKVFIKLIYKFVLLPRLL